MGELRALVKSDKYRLCVQEKREDRFCRLVVKENHEDINAVRSHIRSNWRSVFCLASVNVGR